MKTREKKLQVIGAGFGRTGTLSLKKALEVVGYGPCYHMRVTLTNYFHMKFWVRAVRGQKVNWKHFFRNYRATVDWPACEFYQELMEEFPDAKVILTVRDPEKWYDSMRDTICRLQESIPWWFPRVNKVLHEEMLWNGRFKGKFGDKEEAVKIFREHIEEVKKTVPKERLLLYQVKDGWKPLCDFLGAEIPSGPFPHLHDRQSFYRIILLIKIASWLVPLVVLLALLGLSYLIQVNY